MLSNRIEELKAVLDELIVVQGRLEASGEAPPDKVTADALRSLRKALTALQRADEASRDAATANGPKTWTRRAQKRDDLLRQVQDMARSVLGL